MDLHFLSDVIQPSSPCATVYLDVSHDSEDAAHATALRWAEQRSTLAEQGADQDTLDALEAAVTGAEPVVGRAGRVLVARGGRVVLDRDLPEPPAQSSASWAPLPDLLPMLLDRPEPATAVVVRVDKFGGEVYTAGPGGAPEPTGEVKGETYPLHKARGGGWAHLRMQHKVEETWRQNVAALAEQVDAQVSRTAARVLLLAGEQQSRNQLRKELGERSAGIAADLEGTGGSEGPGSDELAAAVDAAVHELTVADRTAVLERYEQAAGRPDGLAVDGLAGVLAALRAEAVDTLLLDADVPRETSVVISEVPSQVAVGEDELRAIGAEPTARVPVDPALLRAAAGSGAALVPVGGDTGVPGPTMADGVAALLRYPLPTGA